MEIFKNEFGETLAKVEDKSLYDRVKSCIPIRLTSDGESTADIHQTVIDYIAEIIKDEVGDDLPNEVNDVRNYVNGASDYNKHKYQVWDFWIKYKINNGFDCDLTKRVLRIKKTDGRLLDYRKMKHIALERIRQFQNNENVFPIENTEPKDVTFEEMIDDYNLKDDDKIILSRILYPNVKDRVSDYEEIINICNKRICELEKEEK